MSEEEEEQEENKNNVERLGDDIFIILEGEPYLDQMNALLSVIAHNLFEAHKAKEKRRESLQKVHDALLSNIEYMEAHGQYVDDSGNSVK